ncbi:phospholipid phosphatase 1 isoform X1 [Apis cerana]|uniref:phospholipid phosphatase 1 isoform X1 n=2 Tax=Apis cerana TaxID=7461 RepID=UPI002B238B06|nr:phospholipid phosphatase 1 isoform X1 [Apis cerana]
MQRSTEQLTRCSTGTLEDILDNSNGITTRTVSEKIMSICKNTTRWILVFDVFLALSVIVLLGVLEFRAVPRQYIGFYCNDPKISFKFKGDTISNSFLIFGCLLIPIIVMWIAEFVCYPANSYATELGYVGSRAKQIWLWYRQFLIGSVSLLFTCEVIKTVIGEPRPHFLDTCKPREAENCTDGYVEKYTCTNTNVSDWSILDSSRSFPSGHSCLSMHTTIFIICYIQRRLPDRSVMLKPWLQLLMCMWTVVCSLTRLVDNRHHWWDVLAGIIMGFICGTVIVNVLCCKFHINRKISQIYCENGQVNIDYETKQNGKKLLHETTIDLSENRELKNVKSSTWKE